MSTRTITLALTHYNRFHLLLECVANVICDPRISEVVISDDVSTDGSFEALQKHFEGNQKVKIFRNDQNLDCHYNKQKAVLRSTNEWVILFDSDNILPVNYLDVLFSIPEWDPNTVYCPDFAEPHFNYTFWAGKLIDRSNIAEMLAVSDQGHPPFMNRRQRERLRIKEREKDKRPIRIATALNTCNYFVHRLSYLETWDGSINPHTADSIYQIYRWLVSNRNALIVPNLRYFHRVHDGSHYKHNWKKTGRFAQEVENKLRRLTA